MKSARPERNLQILEDFCSPFTLLDYGSGAAVHYGETRVGETRANLERKGTPIGIDYLHIAGHVRNEGLPLVKNTLKGFERVEGLRLKNWM